MDPALANQGSLSVAPTSRVRGDRLGGDVRAALRLPHDGARGHTGAHSRGVKLFWGKQNRSCEGAARQLGERLQRVKERRDARNAATARRLRELGEIAAAPERLNPIVPGEYGLFS
jgi:hypothetical protein